MAVDASKLKRRRGLGAPPTEGAPGIEEAEILQQEQAAETHPLAQPRFPDSAVAKRAVGEINPSSPVAEPVLNGEGDDDAELEPEHKLEAEPEFAVAPRWREAPAERQERGGKAAPARRGRVPAPQAEPRIPFTTRVSVSTKERLEDACYHLRRRHQDFINEAILAHLKKHGF